MIGQILLWLFVIVLGIELGAGLYETLVVLPLWNWQIPDSVISYYQHNAANPQFALSAGPRFWMFFTPLLGLLSIAALLSGLRTRSEHRKWRIAGTGLVIIIVTTTFAWFVPNIMTLGSADVLTLGRDQVASIANNWVNLNWVRVVAYSLAWLTTLRAFSIPSEDT